MTSYYYQMSIRTYYLFEHFGIDQIFRIKTLSLPKIRNLKSCGEMLDHVILCGKVRDRQNYTFITCNTFVIFITFITFITCIIYITFVTYITYITYFTYLIYISCIIYHICIIYIT